MHPDLVRAAELLTAEPDVVLAIAYGSLISGRAHAESDLDVAVWTEAPLTVDRRMALVRALALATGRAIDLVDLRAVGVPLSQTILCDGTVLVRRDERLYAELAIRMLADVEDFLPLRRRLLRERRERWIR